MVLRDLAAAPVAHIPMVQNSAADGAVNELMVNGRSMDAENAADGHLAREKYYEDFVAGRCQWTPATRTTR